MTHKQNLIVGGAILAVTGAAAWTVEALGVVETPPALIEIPSQQETPPEFKPGMTAEEYEQWLRETRDWWEERRELRGLGNE